MNYKILPPAQCNTASMHRVTYQGHLVALFVSHVDAQAYIDERQAKRKRST